MKRTQHWSLILLLLINLFCFFSFSLLAHAATDPRLIKVGIYINNPKVFLDDKHQAAGIYPDILNYIAKQENWQIEYVPGTWEEGLTRLEQGDINLMVDVALTEERQIKYDFTKETVLSSWGTVFVRKNSDIDSFKDLDGKTIAILKSSVYSGGPEGVDKYIKTFELDTKFIYVDEYKQVFDLVEKHQADAAVVSRIFALTNSSSYPDLKETDIFFSPTELRFALTKNSPDNPYLINKIDYWIKKIKTENNGIYHQTLEKYGLAGMISSKEVIPDWIKASGWAILAFFVGALSLIFVLRRARSIAINQLKEKEILLSNVINHAPILIFALDPQGLLTLAEGRALQDLQLKKKLPIGQPITDLFKHDSNTTTQIQKALRGEEIETKVDLINKTWRVNFTPIINQNEIKSVVGVAIDLTEEYQLDQAKSEFLSLVSHHLRTLPSVIRWTAEILSPKMKQVLDPKDYKSWQRIENSNLKMIELAEVISRASQLELEKFDSNPELFNLPELIDRELLLLDPTIRKNQLKIINHYHLPNFPDVYLDISQVKIILRTLLSNAVRYISTKGTVEISLQLQKNTFILTVKDTGWGIPTAQQQQIFTKLFRATNVIKMDVIGIGLGLFIAKSIVNKLNGKIWFKSTQNKGSTFFVELPIKQW